MRLSPDAAAEIARWLDPQSPPVITGGREQRSATDLILLRMKERLKAQATGKSEKVKSSAHTLLMMLDVLFLERRKHGIDKYGHEVVSHNGRSALTDALQESVDLLVYAAQMVLEEPSEFNDTVFDSAARMVVSLTYRCCEVYLEEAHGRCAEDPGA